MSVTLFDLYVPAEIGAGAQANIERWRKMAKMYARDGVVRPKYFNWPPSSGEQNPLSVYGWDWGSGAVSVAPGPCWVNGFYGRNYERKVLAVPAGGQGLVVVRLDPIAQELLLVFRPGAAGPGDVIRQPDGLWEIPLAWMQTDGQILDLREYTPVEILPPPVTEIPSWVPLGLLQIDTAPATNMIVGAETQYIHVAYPGANARFIAGRSYRFTFSTHWQTPVGFEHITFVNAWVRDDPPGGMRRVENMYVGTHPQLAGPIMSATTSFSVDNCGAGLVAVVEARAPGGTMTFLAGGTRIEIEDVG